MKQRGFGKLGWSVGEIGMGCWAIGKGWGWGPQDDEVSVQALHRALDLGANFLDTAQGYGDGHSERLIGRVLKERGGPSKAAGGKRLFIATKVPPQPGSWPPRYDEKIEGRFSEDYLRERVQFSLKNLGVERLDLLQVHTWTGAWNKNPLPFKILGKLKREGLIEAVGVSTPEDDQTCVVDLMRQGWVDSIQVIYNIFDQVAAAEILPEAQEHGVVVLVRLPFDEGSLTGKFKLDTVFDEKDLRRVYFGGDRLKRTVERVEKIRQTLGPGEPDLAAAALKFILRHPAVSVVIPGVRNPAQAEANLSVSDRPPLSDTHLQELKNHFWNRGIWYAA